MRRALALLAIPAAVLAAGMGIGCLPPAGVPAAAEPVPAARAAAPPGGAPAAQETTTSTGRPPDGRPARRASPADLAAAAILVLAGLAVAAAGGRIWLGLAGGYRPRH